MYIHLHYIAGVFTRKDPKLNNKNLSLLSEDSNLLGGYVFGVPLRQ